MSIQKIKDNYILRLAVDEDLPAILAIWKDGLMNSQSKDLDTNSLIISFKENFKNRNAYFNFWVVWNGSVLGWCSILPAFSHPFKQNTNAEVSTYILKEYSSNKLGTELMKYVFSEIGQSVLEIVWGFAQLNNIASIKMCENATMRICGQTSNRVILIKEFAK